MSGMNVFACMQGNKVVPPILIELFKENDRDATNFHVFMVLVYRLVKSDLPWVQHLHF